LAVAADLGAGMVWYAVGAVVELGTLFSVYLLHLWVVLERRKKKDGGK